MSEDPVNPYESPAAESVAASAEPRRSNDTRFLWIWLAWAVVVSFLGTPADPISLVLALLYGLFCFFVGVCFATAWPRAVRLLPLIVWCSLTILSLSVGWHFTDILFPLGVAVYGGVSIGLGHRAWTSLRSVAGGRRILAGFAIGYILGAMLCLIGVVVGPILGVMLAKRTVDSR